MEVVAAIVIIGLITWGISGLFSAVSSSSSSSGTTYIDRTRDSAQDAMRNASRDYLDRVKDISRR